MKKKYLILLIAMLWQLTSLAQIYTDTQEGSDPTINFNNFVVCQDSAELIITEFSNLTFSSSDCSSGDIGYTVSVNGTQVVGSCQATPHTIDLTNYMPVNTVTISVSSFFSDTIRISAEITVTGTTTPLPIFSSPVNYLIGETTEPLNVTGTSLLWYDSAIGGTGSFNAPVPDTSVEGVSSYWVSQTLGGCESLRSEIKVAVRTLNATGKSLHFDGVNDYVNVSNFDFSTANTFTLDFLVKPEKIITIPTETTTGIIGSTNQSYAIFPTLISFFTPLVDAENAMAGVSVGTNGIVVFEHRGFHLPALLSWTGTITDWTRVTVVFDNKEPSLYINGAFVKTGLTSSTLNVYPGTRDFGNSDNATHMSYGPFQGGLDKLYILNKAVIPVSECEPAPVSADIIASYNFSSGIAGGDNTSASFLFDETNSFHGELFDFTLNGTTSNWLADSYNGQFNVPTVTSPVIYNQGDIATQLTATTGENDLLWYDNANGGVGTITAPTPNTSINENISYWVASTTVDGCESERVEIEVTINIAAATHLNFDGVNDFVTKSNEAAFNFSVGTVEAWIKPVANNNNKAVVSMRTNANASETRWSLHVNEGSNKIGIYNGIGVGYSDIAVSGGVSANVWSHVVWVMNTTQTTVYFNGALVGTIARGINVMPTNMPLTVGTSDINNSFPIELFNGDIDEVRVWNTERSADQIIRSKDCELQGDETGLVTYYQFNQGMNAVDNTTITSLVDGTINGNNGALTNFNLTESNSNWLAGSPVTTGSIVPSMATVTTPVTYTQNDSATALTATVGANGTSLLWYITATSTTGSATAPTPSTSTLGDTSYFVSSKNANGCESDRTEIVVTVSETLSINDEFITKDFTLYPNPTSNNISIVFKKSTDVSIQVYDLRGRLLISKNDVVSNETVSLSHLSAGTYIFKISTSKGEVVKRVIKK